jgi:hypothetical protein
MIIKQRTTQTKKMDTTWKRAGTRGGKIETEPK